MRSKLAILTLSCVLPGWAGEVPRPAPPLELTTYNGQRLALADLRGKVVLLMFFLTECSHCQRTTTNIMPIYREWRSRGLEVVGVAINPDAKQRVHDFIRRFNATFPIGFGSSSTVTSFAEISAVARFHVPYLFMIDRRGVIRYEHPGQDSGFFSNEEQNLRAQLDELLKEPARGGKTARKTSGS